jgi:hypothetical protein
MIGDTYTGASYTNIANTAGSTFYPSTENGATTPTAGSSFTADAKRVIIYAIVVRTFSAGTTAFTLQAHDGTEIAAITPTGPGTLSFGPVGIDINSGWRLTQGASTASTLLVIWKKVV